MMQWSSEQALAQYHAVYDNDAYRALTDELTTVLAAGSDLTETAIRNTPDYITLSNLIINTALGCCGYGLHAHDGWQLATSLQAVLQPRLAAGHLTANDIQDFMDLLDGYFGLYRHAMRELHTTISQDNHHKATLHGEAAWRSSEDAMRISNGLSGWRGRTAYHLSSAATSLLRTAHLLLEYPHDNIPKSHWSYVAEKFGRAMRDLSDAVQTIQPHVKGTSFVELARDALSNQHEEA